MAEGETVEVGTLLAQLEADGAAVASGDAAGSKDGRADRDPDGEAAPEAEQKTELSAGAEKPEAEQIKATEDLPVAEMEKAASEETAFKRHHFNSRQFPSRLSLPPRLIPLQKRRLLQQTRKLRHSGFRLWCAVCCIKHGIDPASIAGTGPKGRITRKDAEEAVKKAGSASRGASAAKKTATVSSTGRMSPTTIARGTAMAHLKLQPKQVRSPRLQAQQHLQFSTHGNYPSQSHPQSYGRAHGAIPKRLRRMCSRQWRWILKKWKKLGAHTEPSGKAEKASASLTCRSSHGRCAMH